MSSNRKQRTNGGRDAGPAFDINESVERAVLRLMRATDEGETARLRAARAASQAQTLEELSEPDESPAAEVPAAASRPCIQVYDDGAVARRRRATKTYDDADSKGRVEALLDSMLARGGWRQLRPLDPNWRERLDELEASFPNCAPLFRYVRGQAALAMRHDGALPGLAVLLDGPPGVGKSVIAEILGELLGGGFMRVPMAAAQSGSQLAGSEDFWTNAKHGAVFDALVNGDFANPLIQLDEVDKVKAEMRYDPLGALYDLLEPAAARRFADRTFPTIALDASRILWVATSNDRRLIPAPILDRLTLISIREPTRAESLRVVASVDRRLHNEHPALAGMRISKSVLEALTGAPPRRVRRALQEAYGNAAYNGREVVLCEDVPHLDEAVPAIGFR